MEPLVVLEELGRGDKDEGGDRWRPFGETARSLDVVDSEAAPSARAGPTPCDAAAIVR